MTGVDIFEILVTALCLINLVICVVTVVHELIVWVKKKRHERAEEQEMIMILKDKNYRFSNEICALRAKVTELEAKAIPKKPIGEGSYYLCPCCRYCGQALDRSGTDGYFKNYNKEEEVGGNNNA